MVAETLTGARASAAARRQLHGAQLAGHQIKLWGTYSIAANVEDGDIFELFVIPPKTLIFGGALWASDMDTGTEALDMDLGWAANGGLETDSYVFPDGQTTLTNVGYQADPDGFGNFGVWTGDAITDLIAGGNYRPIPMLTGPLYFDRQTMVQLEANVAAATFAAGTVFVQLDAVRL